MLRKNCTDKNMNNFLLQLNIFWKLGLLNKNCLSLRRLVIRLLSASYASAAYTGALTQTENEFREFRKENLKLINSYQTFLNDITENDKIVSDATLSDRQKAT